MNIGDIAHTPGMLALLEKHRPGAEITLWPSSVDRGVEEILRARFPKLKIAKTKAEQERALAACDFFLHGSGPGLVGRKEVVKGSVLTIDNLFHQPKWIRETPRATRQIGRAHV